MFQILSPLSQDFAGKYLTMNKQFRILWSEDTSQLLRYSELPKKTLNFDVFPVILPNTFTQKALETTWVSRYEKYVDDIIVSEIWEGSLSTKAGFFYALKKLINTNTTLYWFPKDKTYIVFQISPLSLIVGDAENQSINPIGGWVEKDFKYLVETMTFTFKINKLYNIPDFNIYME